VARVVDKEELDYGRKKRVLERQDKLRKTGDVKREAKDII